MPGSRVLIAEDEILVAKDIRDALLHLGHEVVEIVSSGEDAVEKTGRSKPDLILMDIVLQGTVDGIEAARLIRERFGVPIIFLTAFSDDATLNRAKVTAPFGYLLKPVEERDLKATIEVALYKARLDRELSEREKWMGTILRSIEESVIAVDERGRVTYLNAPAEALTGWGLSEAAGRPLEEVVRTTPEISDLPESEFQLTRKDGRVAGVETRISPIQGAPGGQSGRIVILRDISLRRRAEDELIKSWERLRSGLSAAVLAMSLTIEMRDPYTAGHQRRVGQLASAIAKDMGLHKDQIEGIRLAGDIHDIGKIHIPVEILSKPGRLTAAEFAYIQTHAKAGYEILKSIEFPWPIAQIVYQHHERINGSGYPNRLKMREIMLEARIMSVADVVEAMSSHRPYRPAPGIHKALEEITQNMDKLYDSDVVKACNGLFESGRFVFEETKPQ